MSRCRHVSMFACHLVQAAKHVVMHVEMLACRHVGNVNMSISTWHVGMSRCWHAGMLAMSICQISSTYANGPTNLPRAAGGLVRYGWGTGGGYALG